MGQPKGIQTLADGVAAIEKNIKDAKEVVRELHEVIKEGRIVLKEMRDWEQNLKGFMHAEWEQMAVDSLKDHVQMLTEGLSNKQQEMYRTIQEGFQKSVNLCLYGNDKGTGVNIFDRLAAIRDEIKAVDGVIIEL